MLGHHALIYSSPEEFLSCAVEYVRAGLEQGDAVLVATPHGDALTEALEQTGAPTTGLEVVDDAAWHRVPAWTIGQYARKAERSARRGARLRALIELRWHATLDPALAAVGPVPDSEWERYEAVLNSALADLPFELCCAYNQSILGEQVIAAARCTHPSMLHLTGTQDSPVYLGAADFLASHPQPSRLPVPSDALRMEFGAAEIPSVRQTTLSWARAAGLVEDDAQEYLIAVYEIVSNAVEHGGGRGISWLWQDGRQLFCEVRSARTIPNPLAGYQPPGTAQERGRGLWLARQICDQVTIYNDDGAIVQLTKTMP
jgi:anti-sigma regulatory factor (Ser/Thr protein kinase)